MKSNLKEVAVRVVIFYVIHDKQISKNLHLLQMFGALENYAKVLKAIVEMQVQSWTTNSEFGSKCKY